MPVLRQSDYLVPFKGRGILDGIKNIFGAVGRVASSIFGSAKKKGLQFAKEALPIAGDILKQQALQGLTQVASGRDPLDVLRQRTGVSLQSGVQKLRPTAQRSVASLLQQAKKEVEQQKSLSDLKQLVKRGIGGESGEKQESVASLLSKLLDKKKINGSGISQL